MKRNSVLCFAMTLFFSLYLASAAVGQTLKFATEDADSYPWTMKDGSGVNFDLINKAADNIGVKVEFVLYPWKRCLESLKNNTVDGAFSASYKKKRTEMGVYPTTADGKPDASRQLHSSTYALYVQNGSDLSWDGEKFVNLTGKIGAPAGYSIIEKLKEKGATVAEVPSTDKLVKMLAIGRLQGVASLTTQVDYALKNDSAAAGKIKIVEPPLVEKPYYLMLSHKLVKENAALANKLWDEIRKVRESAEYKKMYDDFMNK